MILILRRNCKIIHIAFFLWLISHRDGGNYQCRLLTELSTWHYVREESRCRFIYFMFFERTLHHRMKRELDSELRCKCYKMVNGTRVSATTFNFQKFHFSSKNFQWLEMKNYVHLHCNRNFGKFFQMKNKLHISEYFFTASNKCKLATSAA